MLRKRDTHLAEMPGLIKKPFSLVQPGPYPIGIGFIIVWDCLYHFHLLRIQDFFAIPFSIINKCLPEARNIAGTGYQAAICLFIFMFFTVQYKQCILGCAERLPEFFRKIIRNAFIAQNPVQNSSYQLKSSRIVMLNIAGLSNGIKVIKSVFFKVAVKI